MGAGQDDERPAGEVLDLGVVGEPASPPDGEDGHASGPLSRRALLAGTGLLVAGAVGVGVSRRLSSPSGTSSATAPGSRKPVEITHLSRAWPGAGDWDLFGLGDDVLLRIHPASGRVTLTQVPSLGEGVGEDEVSFVPVRHRVLVRALGDAGPGVVVPDDGPPVTMPTSLAGIGVVLPGPDPDHVWIEAAEGQMALVTLDGRHTGVVVPVPEFATTGPMVDGAGGLLFEGVGGLYHIAPTGVLQVTDAILLAVGTGALLTLEHDGRGRWRTFLRPHGGDARVVPVAIGPQLPHGVLAPGGRAVVLYVLEEPERISVNLALVDLGPGIPDVRRVHRLSVPVGAGEGTVVWSPDGRRLVSVDGSGRLTLIDAATLRATPLAPDLPAVRQLAVRTAS